MIAAHHDRPNIIAVILLYTFSKLCDDRLEKGIYARDHDGLTAAQIAMKRCNVASLSVLLHLYPKLADPVEDFSSYPSLLDIAILPHPKADETLAFFNVHYPDIERQILDMKATLLQNSKYGIVPVNWEYSVGKVYYEALISSCLTKGYRFLRTLPKSMVLISIDTAIIISMYVLGYISCLHETRLHVNLLHFCGVILVVFIRSLYSKLCSESPGSFQNQPDQHPRPQDFPHAPDSEFGLVKARKSYGDALNMVYSVSNIARKSRSQQLEQVENTEDLLSTSFCCHYCRTYRPLRSMHSKSLRRCIPQFDHYCVFLGNHVGRDNYPYYISSLLAAVGAVMPLFILNLHHYLYHIRDISGSTAREDTGITFVTFFGTYVLNKDKSPVMKEITFVRLHNTISTIVLMIDFKILKPLECFLFWSCLWWCIFLFLLCVHLYLICIDATTRECLDSFSTTRSRGKGNYSAKPTDFRFSNIVTRMFPTNDDVCFNNTDLHQLQDRPLLSLNDCKSRIILSLSEILSGQANTSVISARCHDSCFDGKQKCK